MPDSNPHENRQLAMLDRPDRVTGSAAERAPPMPSSPRAIYAGDAALAPVPKPVQAVPPKSATVADVPKVPIILAKAIKVVIGLDPAQLLGLRVRDGDLRTPLIVEVGGRRVTVDLASKSVRKAMKTIRENGVDGTLCGLQGTLKAGDVLTDAGLSAQVKVVTPT